MANEEANQKANQETTTNATQLKSTKTIITFGTLSFIINHEEVHQQKQQDVLPETFAIPGRTHSLNSPVRTTTDNRHTTVRSQPTPTPTEHNQGRRNPYAKQNNTTPRFFKVPQATKEWQQVVNKKGKKEKREKRIIECFYCHRKGHVQRNCWRRIECFTCGEYGHKFARCPFKPLRTPRNTITKQPTNPPQEIDTPPNSPTMDPIQGRPLLGDTFCPPTLTLKEENEYLGRVGLIILIRGSPSPDLPWLMAEKLVAVHGGHPSDYIVSEATITPYLLTCSGTQLRDATVQRGIYSIPQAWVQFTIHEWQPRFGMGYDPVDYQV